MKTELIRQIGNFEFKISNIENVTVFHIDGYKATYYINSAKIGIVYCYGDDNKVRYTCCDANLLDKLIEEYKKSEHSNWRDFEDLVEDVMHEWYVDYLKEQRKVIFNQNDNSLTIKYPDYMGANFAVNGYSDLMDLLGKYNVVSASEIQPDYIVFDSIVYKFTGNDSETLHTKEEVTLNKVGMIDDLIDKNSHDDKTFLAWYKEMV